MKKKADIYIVIKEKEKEHGDGLVLSDR